MARALPSVVDTSSDYSLLKWAVSHIADEQRSPLSNLARSIYSAYWKCAARSDVADQLAEGYENAALKYMSPFIEKGHGVDDKSSLIISRDAFLKDANSRFAVLEKILTRTGIKDDQIHLISIFDYPLITPDDLPRIFSISETQFSGHAASRWAACINALIYRCDVSGYAKEIDSLNKLRPDLIKSYETIKVEREASLSQAKDYERQWKDREAGRQTEGLSAQSLIDREIKELLQNPDCNPEFFPKIAAFINSANGTPLLPSLDLQQSTGWGKLDEVDRASLIDLAERYLRNADIPPTDLKHENYAPTQALVLIQRHRPAIYEEFSEDVWGKCGLEVLKVERDDNGELVILFDTLARRFPNVAEDAIIGVLRQQLSRGYISIFRRLGDRFSDAQASAVMQVVRDKNINNEQRASILEELAIKGKLELVRGYLDNMFKMGWDNPQAEEFHRFRMLAFQISPTKYITQVLDTLAKDRKWGRQWLESVIGVHNGRLLGAILACSSQDIASLYVWLHREYPPNTRPEHGGATFTPTALDEIHQMKSH